ncbi:MAG TPA: hypothetical protein VFY84_08290 [Jiangellales bacterium]|nr:hypothetical protein [Jiangellales bacterium]
MSASIIETSLHLLRHRWRPLLVVAVLTLGPAVAATSLIEVLGSRTGAIVNGSVVAATDHWTDVVVAANAGGTAVRVTVPVLLALAWFVALGVGLRVLAGSPLRAIWREFSAARLGSWLALGAVLGALALLSLYASAVLAGLIDGNSAPLGVIAALLCAYGLARLALALPAMLVDGYDLPGSLRRAASITRGRALLNGTALILIGVVPPSVLPMLIDARILPTGDTWIVDVIWTGVASLLEYLVVLAAFPLQAVVLLGAYRVAVATSAASARTSAGIETSPDDPEPTAGDDEAETSAAGDRPVTRSPDDERDLSVTMDDGRVLAATVAAPLTDQAVTETPVLTRRPPRWVGAAGLTLLVIAPAVASPAAVLTNPRGLPVATIVRPEYGFSPRPLDLAVLADGTVVMVDELQATLCYDTHCTDLETLIMPCYGGGEPEPEGAGVLSCAAEGPLIGADIASDGTLLAVTRGRDQNVRVFGCRLVPNRDGQCQWSGAPACIGSPTYGSSGRWMSPPSPAAASRRRWSHPAGTTRA